MFLFLIGGFIYLFEECNGSLGKIIFFCHGKVVSQSANQRAQLSSLSLSAPLNWFDSFKGRDD